MKLHLLGTAVVYITWFANAQQLPPGMAIGVDGPADQATTGFWTNHIGLNVRNLTASKHFYGTILGMRHIFTIQYTPSFSLTYMGFSQVGKALLICLL